MTGRSSWSEEVEFVMRRSGWFPGRRVDVEGWATELRDQGLDMHPTARDFLAEFGGLVVNVDDLGTGVDYARTSFELDPLESDAMWSLFGGVEERAHGGLYPLGNFSDGGGSLAIDEAGDIYAVFVPKFIYIGRERVALASMIEGRNYTGEPMFD